MHLLPQNNFIFQQIVPLLTKLLESVYFIDYMQWNMYLYQYFMEYIPWNNWFGKYCMLYSSEIIISSHIKKKTLLNTETKIMFNIL